MADQAFAAHARRILTRSLPGLALAGLLALAVSASGSHGPVHAALTTASRWTAQFQASLSSRAKLSPLFAEAPARRRLHTASAYHAAAWRLADAGGYHLSLLTLIIDQPPRPARPFYTLSPETGATLSPETGATLSPETGATPQPGFAPPRQNRLPGI